MLGIKEAKRYKKWIAGFFGFVLFCFLGLLVVAQFMVVPVLKKRLHALIVQGSGGLYKYTLGDIDASVFGGSVELKDFYITLDSARYQQLKKANELPSLTLEAQMIKGEIKGIALFSLLFNKKIVIDQIITKEANIRLFRHLLKTKNVATKAQPLWKAIQPDIKSISVESINLDGVKLLYRNADSGTAVKLQFDTCFAVFNNVLIDSASFDDTSRIGFSKEVALRFSDLKFRSPDSSSKLKAERITYSSKEKELQITNFKVQPTREEKADFYAFAKAQEEMKVITFEKATFSNFSLPNFINNNQVAADSVVVEKPDISIYVDKSQPPLVTSKVGKYPHQLLAKAGMEISIANVTINDAAVNYTEKAAKTGQEGTLTLSNITLTANNITNIPTEISKNNKCTALVNGLILGSPISTLFTFFLDSTKGRFDISGQIKNVAAAELNKLSVPFANVRFQTFNLQQLSFDLTGNDDVATGKVSMLYNNLFLTVNKTDKETGQTTPNKFLTTVLNKYTLYSSNPAPGGAVRTASVKELRVTSKSFFGLFWKTVFGGMQSVLLKHGQLE